MNLKPAVNPERCSTASITGLHGSTILTAYFRRALCSVSPLENHQSINQFNQPAYRILIICFANESACCERREQTYYNSVYIIMGAEKENVSHGCKDACCGDAARDHSAESNAAGHGGHSGNGAGSSSDLANINHCSSGAETPTQAKSEHDDDCCKPKDHDVHHSQADNCCSTSQHKAVPDAHAGIGEHADAGNSSTIESDCCKDGQDERCDTSCLDRLAQRECEEDFMAVHQKQSDGKGKATECHTVKEGEACEDHLRATFDRWAATLEELGCLCRSLIALGQKSCCVSQGNASAGEKRGSKAQSAKPARTGFVKTFHVEPSEFVGKAGRGAKGPVVSARCCNDEHDDHDDHESHDTDSVHISNSCGDTCCSGEEHGVSEKTDTIAVHETLRSDLEKGRDDSEHVILSVSGMTCSGCESKLKRMLEKVVGVKHLKTSLALSRAEFDYNFASGSIDDVLKHLGRTTEFRYERLLNGGTSIDVIPAGDVSQFLAEKWPDGVTDMSKLDDNSVSIAFDASVVGARDLIQKGWDIAPTLAPPRSDPALEAGNKHVQRTGYMTFLSAILTIPVLVLTWAPLPENDIAYGSASLALATLVQVLIAGPFYPTALKGLIFSRIIEMDLLIVLSTSTAYIFSVISFAYLVAGQPLSTGQFFETSTLLVTLIMVGRYVSALARQKAVESISFRSLQISNAIIVDSVTKQENEIDVRLLQYGDVFKVVPESKIPTDGTVISGSSEVDESMLTGESRPVEKHTKSNVIAGSINGSGALVVRLTRLPSENTISTIAGLVDQAKLSKPKIQDMADHVASYFVPVIIGLVIITFSTWIAIGIVVRKESATDATINAITYGITVLIVSCPCAIGLAVPMVIIIASGVAAEKGVIFKSADSIEVAYRTSHVVFDKTGTLTQGKLSVVREVDMGNDWNISSSLLLGLVGDIKHPVSAAVSVYLKAKGVNASTMLSQKSLVGKGVEGTTPNSVLRAGNSHWLGLSTHPQVQPLLSQGYTVMCFTINDVLSAVFALQDSLRPEASDTIAILQNRKISVHVISGDDDGAVRSIASQLSIPSGNVRSRCTPADKQQYIRQLLDTRPSKPSRVSWFLPSSSSSSSNPGANPPSVIFCGDGTNDAIALAQSTIGISLNSSTTGTGTDVAKSAADVILMRPDLSRILTMISVSKAAVNRIKFNFAWCVVYNVFAILLGAGAFVNARIPPEFAGLGELVSVVPVIGAAVMLKWGRGYE